MDIKDSVLNKYVKEKLKEDEMDEFGKGIFPPDALDYYLKTKAFRRMDSINAQYFNQQYNTLSYFNDYFKKDLNYRLEMPGKILKTNSKHVDNNQLNWRINAYRFALTDYEIYAQSRKANIWAFLLSGIIVALAGYSFFRKK